jgi:PilZ domain
MDRAVAAAASGAGPELGVDREPERTPERRVAARTPASALPWMLGCRITPGHDVRIVDLSAAGMLVESAAPLCPGRAAILVLTRGERRLMLTGTVVRSHVSAIDRSRGATYEVGIAFERHVDALRELARV